MADRRHYRDLLERVEAAVRKRPALGQTTYRTEIRRGEGVEVSAREGDWYVNTDMPPVIGGSGIAPTPGFLLRAAVGTCLGSSLLYEAARLDLDLRDFRIDVEADDDARGELAIDETYLCYGEIRCTIALDCDVDDAGLENLVQRALGHSPMVAMVKKGAPMTFQITRL